MGKIDKREDKAGCTTTLLELQHEMPEISSSY